MTGYMNSDGSSLVGGLLPSGIGEALQLDSGGNLLISGSISATNPSVSATGAAIPTSSTLIGGSDGVDLRAISVDSSGRLTSIIQVVGGTALAADQSNTIIRTSLYVKKSAAGDTVLVLGSATSANSLPVVIASDQGVLSSQGPIAAGSANGNNPIKTGGVFNTTQPTVTNGQIVDAQYTARGAAIIATGTDPLTSIIQVVGGTALVADQSNTELRASVYGKSSTAGDTALGLDASGRVTSIIQVVGGTALAADQTNSIIRTSLYVKKSAAGDTVLVLGSATSANSLPVVIASDQGNVPTNNAQWNGAAPGVANPVIIQQLIAQYIINAQGYTASNGNLTTGASTTTGASLYNPNASGKTMYVYSIRIGINGSIQYSLQTGITTDPALGSNMVITNNKNAGAASVASATYLNSASTFSTGNIAEYVFGSGNTTLDILVGGQILVLPANSGIGVLVIGNTTKYTVTFKWIEL